MNPLAPVWSVRKGASVCIPPAILDRVSALVLRLTPGTYQVDWANPAARQRLGLTATEPAEARTLLDLLPGWALARALTESIPAATESGSWTGELAFSGGNEREVHVSATLLAERDETGELLDWILLAEDQSEARRGQAEVESSEELFRVIAQNAADIVALFDTSGHSLYDSSSCRPVLGYGPGQLTERWMWEKVQADDTDKMVGAFLDATGTGASRSVEVQLAHQDGGWRTFELNFGGLHGANGTVDRVVLTGRDITQRRVMEVQMRQGQKLEAIGQLAAGIAHEINSPTQFIGDNTRFLRDAFADLQKLVALHDRLRREWPASEDTPPLLAEIDRMTTEIDLPYLMEEIPKAILQSLDGLGRVGKIVQAMKEFSHPGTTEKTPIDLNRAIESTLTVARHEWKYVADMALEFAPDLPPVPCLPGDLNQVVLNLVVNAAHAIGDAAKLNGGKKGTITVSTRLEGDWVEIRVRDTGTGIPAKVQGRIFDPFFTTKEVGKGTGQGLSISRSVVVDKHRGTLTFTTQPGAGSTFIVRLPLFPDRPETKPS